MDAENTHQVFDWLWTSGQLSRRDIEQLPALGIEVVVNLALPTSSNALSGEAELITRQGIAYVPFFPLGGFTPLQSSGLSAVAQQLGATPLQVALAWLLQRSPNILLIPGTSSVAHLRENLAAGQLTLSADTLAQLDAI